MQSLCFVLQSLRILTSLECFGSIFVQSGSEGLLFLLRGFAWMKEYENYKEREILLLNLVATLLIFHQKESLNPVSTLLEPYLYDQHYGHMDMVQSIWPTLCIKFLPQPIGIHLSWLTATSSADSCAQSSCLDSYSLPLCWNAAGRCNFARW